MSNYQIAIVGRPNVGKSTFFNRLSKQRKAIVGSEEGITRDRIYGEVEWSGHILTFIDTGGYIPEDVDVFNSAVRDQALAAVSESDLILFMVDGKNDPTASDKSLARLVRHSGKKFILASHRHSVHIGPVRSRPSSSFSPTSPSRSSPPVGSDRSGRISFCFAHGAQPRSAHCPDRRS